MFASLTSRRSRLRLESAPGRDGMQPGSVADDQALPRAKQHTTDRRGTSASDARVSLLAGRCGPPKHRPPLPRAKNGHFGESVAVQEVPRPWSRAWRRSTVFLGIGKAQGESGLAAAAEGTWSRL